MGDNGEQTRGLMHVFSLEQMLELFKFEKGYKLKYRPENTWGQEIYLLFLLKVLGVKEPAGVEVKHQFKKKKNNKKTPCPAVGCQTAAQAIGLHRSK